MIRGSIVCLLLLHFSAFQSGVRRSVQESLNERIATPAELSVIGPSGIRLRFSNPAMGLYRHAEILRLGRPPVHIGLAPDGPNTMTLVDGIDADANNASFAGRLSKSTPWALTLWSLDGRYVVLTTYSVIGGSIDQRNSRFSNAYDTVTGVLTHFRGRSASLASGGFIKWSSQKPSVALLDGSKGAEEAFPEK